MFHCPALPRALASTAVALLLTGAPAMAQTASTTVAPAATEPAPAAPSAETPTAAPTAAPAASTTAAAPAGASEEPPSTEAVEGDCVDPASQAEAATSPAPTAEGTAVAGTTGWSGGTGGSQVGTNPQGAVATSKTWHAPTARGLDLMGRPEPVTEVAADASAAEPAAQPAVAVTPEC